MFAPRLSRAAQLGSRLIVAPVLREFVDKEVLPGTSISPSKFWSDFDKICTDLMPRNAELLAKRDRLQSAIDKWHAKYTPCDPALYGPESASSLDEVLPSIALFQILLASRAAIPLLFGMAFFWPSLRKLQEARVFQAGRSNASTVSPPTFAGSRSAHSSAAAGHSSASPTSSASSAGGD